MQVQPRRRSKLPLILGMLAAFVLAVALTLVVLRKPWQASDSTSTDIAASEQSDKDDAEAKTEDDTADEGAATAAAADIRRPLFLAGLSSKGDVDVNPSVPTWDYASDLSNVDVPHEAYISDEAKEVLGRNGFVIDTNKSSSFEFFDVYENNRYNAIANFVTVDSMMHTYHLYFQHLLKGVEKDELSSRLLSLSQGMLAKSQEQQASLAGTEWEEAAKRNVAFFAVGASLLDESTSVPADVSSVVSAELGQISAASGVQESSITGDPIDYTQYIPRGYYAEDPTLEAYFRAMMWYGQAHFKQDDESLDRSAALMTMALTGDELDQWQRIYNVTSFFVGASDDNGYYEYQPALEEAYGADATADTLKSKADSWTSYHKLTGDLPAPQISSLPSLGGADAQKGFRFMGQRFVFDSQVFSQLCFDNVKASPSGEKRTLPDALDVPAALGSDAALGILESRGATSFDGYSDNMSALRKRLSATSASFWDASLYNQWLNTLNPLLTPKGEGYPAFMQTDAWTRKNLQSYLGSYTELKHDTVLYSKQMLAEGDGPVTPDRDDRGYVEPEPQVFTRLSNLSEATADGLEEMGILDASERSDLDKLSEIAERLSTIAKKELEGETPTTEEFELIRSIGVDLEHFWHEVFKDQSEREYFRSMEYPSPIIADVASDTGSTLELATGKPCPMFVVVEVDGVLKVASGPVFVFYQFTQPSSQRMTDDEWREALRNVYQTGLDERTTPQDWTSDFQIVKKTN